MKKNSIINPILWTIVIIGAIEMIMIVGEVFEPKPKCGKYGCDRDRARGSCYCYIHSPVGGSSTHKSKRSKSTQSGSQSESSHYTGSSSGVNSYDDGYEDVYMDGDYDYDRYSSDPDYEDGVEEAMEEFGEDW